MREITVLQKSKRRSYDFLCSRSRSYGPNIGVSFHSHFREWLDVVDDPSCVRLIFDLAYLIRFASVPVVYHLVQQP